MSLPWPVPITSPLRCSLAFSAGSSSLLSWLPWGLWEHVTGSLNPCGSCSLSRLLLFNTTAMCCHSPNCHLFLRTVNSKRSPSRPIKQENMQREKWKNIWDKIRVSLPFPTVLAVINVTLLLSILCLFNYRFRVVHVSGDPIWREWLDGLCMKYRSTRPSITAS